MPYNNTPIDPSDDIKGTTHLPMSRVKKVLAVDDEINQVSNHAVFLCTRAAELFLRQLTEKAYAADLAQRPRNAPKRSLQYDDIARFVHRTDNLEFLCDVIPELTSWGRHKRDRRRKEDVLAEKKAKRATLAAGQTTLDMAGGSKGTGTGPDGGFDPDVQHAPSRPGTSAAAAPLDAVLNDGPGPSPPMPTGPDAQLNGSGRDIRFRHYEPRATNGTGAPDRDGDVPMDG